MCLKGRALHYQAVADFLTVLVDSGIFHDVKLNRTKRKNSDENSTVNFELECRFIPLPFVMSVDHANMQKTSNF